jgi:hypothetical protein
MTDAAIYVRPKGKRFVVGVEPARDGIAPAEFDDHRGAYGFACGLRMTQRLPIKDESEVANG